MKTIYTDGRVFTGRLPLAEAFAVENGHFCAVGTDEELLAMRQEGDAVVSLEGRFVCPGFIDSHMHLLNFGNAMMQCDLASATGSVAELQQALRDFIRDHQLPEGAWVLGRGFNQDYFVPAAEIPTRAELDEVSTTHPVCIVRCCGHCLAVNTRALTLLGLDADTPVPAGGAIDKDEFGRLTGVFRDEAMSLVQARLPVPTLEEIKTRLRMAAMAFNAVGVTSCHTDDLCTLAGVPWQQVIQAYQELEREGKLTVRVYEQSQFTTPESLREFLDSGWNTGVGSEMFRIGPLKMLGDGSLGARTAYMRTPYADAPEERGIAIFTKERFREMIALARSRGMQTAIHVIGDGILDDVLDAYEAVLPGGDSDHRCGVVHVQITRQDQLERMQRLGLHSYVQTIFIDYDARIVHQRVGDALADTSYAFHTLREMGLHVSNGTDCPVERPDPLRGIQCAVTRQPLDGSLPPYRPEEAMSVEEALRSYTVEGAYASFEEEHKGQIRPGMMADFVILSDDPFRTEPSALARLKVLETVLGGRTVYRA